MDATRRIVVALVALLAAPDHGPRETRLWIGGDVHFATHLPRLELPLEDAIGIVNLEGAAAADEDAGASTSARLANARAGLAALSAAGVRVVGIANNHARDLGPDTPERTARDVRGAGLLPAGDVAGAARLESPAGTIAVTAHDLEHGVPAQLADDLARARVGAALLVATFHVTGVPSYLPRPELRAAARVAIEAGARVVAAHGTHAIGPVERRGDAVIAWGLGNLLFACPCTREEDGAVLEVAFAGGALEAAIVPVRAGLDGAPAGPSGDRDLAYGVLDAIGSPPLRREGPRAFF